MPKGIRESRRLHPAQLRPVQPGQKLIDREGIAYDPVKLEEHSDIATDFKTQGLLQAPMVVVGTTAGAGRASFLTRS